jgi:hypothetical protein
MSLYAGFDLHSNNNHLALVDQNGKRVGYWKLANDPELILTGLRSQRGKIVGVVVESTYGDQDHDNPVDTENTLGRIITETSAAGGNVVIPVLPVEWVWARMTSPTSPTLPKIGTWPGSAAMSRAALSKVPSPPRTIRQSIHWLIPLRENVGDWGI